MKHDQLRNVAHNLADSLACGCFIIGYADIHMAREAQANADGEIGVNFLNGTIVGKGSPELRNVVADFAEVLPEFCTKNGVDSTDYCELTAKFSTNFQGLRAEITVLDRMGKRTVDVFFGIPLKRPRVVDHLGRLRPLPGRSN